MADKTDHEVIGEFFQMEGGLSFNPTTERLKQAGGQRKYPIRREIEQADDKRRFNASFAQLMTKELTHTMLNPQ